MYVWKVNVQSIPNMFSYSDIKHENCDFLMKWISWFWRSISPSVYLRLNWFPILKRKLEMGLFPISYSETRLCLWISTERPAQNNSLSKLMLKRHLTLFLCGGSAGRRLHVALSGWARPNPTQQHRNECWSGVIWSGSTYIMVNL